MEDLAFRMQRGWVYDPPVSEVMINANRPRGNLDLDLRERSGRCRLYLRAAAAAVCRTQSAVSQQMQRLEQLVEGGIASPAMVVTNFDRTR